MSTRNEPTYTSDGGGAAELYDSPYNYALPGAQGIGTSSESDEEEEARVVVTGKPVVVTLGHRVLKFFSPVQDGVVVRNAEGNLVVLPIASPTVAIAGHVILSFIFLVAVLAYLVFSLVTFFNRPETTTYLQVESRSLTGQQIRVTASCTNPPHCGTVTIQSNYSTLQLPGCDSNIVTQSTSAVYDTSSMSYINQEDSIILELCYVSDFIFSVSEEGVPTVPGILIDFSSINPGYNTTADGEELVANLENKAIGVVTIETIESSGRKGNTMTKVVSMDAHQVKTVVIGRTITKEGALDEVVDDLMTTNSVQYEGKRSNSFGATAFVRYDSFAVVEKTKKEGTLPEVIANVGGCASIVGTILLIVSPVVGLFLPGHH